MEQETNTQCMETAEKSQAAQSEGSKEKSAEKNNDKKSRWLKKAAIIACGAAAVVIVSMALFFSSYTTVGTMFDFRIFSVSEADIDLTQYSLTSVSGVERCRDLQKLKILDVSAEDIKHLKKCKNLKELVILSQKFDEEQVDGLRELGETISGCDITLIVKLGENAYSTDSSVLNLSGIDDEDAYMLGLFKDLKYIDLSECNISLEMYEKLYAMLPNCNFNQKVMIGGHEYATITTTEIKFESDVSDELEKLLLFKNLKTVDATACTDYDKLVEVYEKLENCNIFWKVNINGFELLSNAEKIDISGKKIADETEIDKLKYFTALEYVDMCQCGFSNTKMEELCNKYPNIKFVWMLTLGKGAWHVRTDAVVFSTLNQNDNINEYDETTFQPIFKYCTDLIALDLGHNKITSLEGIQNLKKLRVLIFVDNKVSDLSPLAELTELEFIEMNINKVTSIEPLRNLNKLKGLNLYLNNGITDFSPLYNKPDLYFVIFPRKTEVTAEGIEAVQKIRETAHPKFRALYASGSYEKTGIYGSLPYRVRFKRAFAQWWAVRDADVGEDWENLKFDKSFDNTNHQYYFNRRYQSLKPDYFYEGTPEYYEDLAKGETA